MPDTIMGASAAPLKAPMPGETLHVPLPAGKVLAFAFNHETMLFDRSGEDLVISTQGKPCGKLLLQGYFAAANADNVPDFILVDGTRIDGKDFLEAMNFDANKFVTEGGLQTVDAGDIFSGGAVFAEAPGGCAARLDMHNTPAAVDTAEADEALAALVRQGFM